MRDASQASTTAGGCGMKVTSILAGVAVVAGVSFVIHDLNDFARVQNAEIGNTPIERGTLSRVVITNNSAQKIAFKLRCDYKVQPRGEQFSRFVVLQPRASVEVDVHPELDGLELPRIIPSKACEATWHGPFGIACRAWSARWEYGKRTHKGISVADEDGACRIATCYSTSRLTKIPSCLSAVYLSR